MRLLGSLADRVLSLVSPPAKAAAGCYPDYDCYYDSACASGRVFGYFRGNCQFVSLYCCN
ncbi:hypothetical protein Afil01_34540 [Actinorhabdospora filicis]|uniref:Uncharacterized protein n=1 Tax=Actinorhabdospora filicis TaxID=1785913 RepID=A0A9W6SMS8_9ACTN|nr:hypothetical protein [Actinorhabdospora filicis]GLZ78647.1 hypothetical protein Afil01_34540 [Actinorhabdospora filicis]